MAQYIDKSALVAEIEKCISTYKRILNKIDKSSDELVTSISMLESKIDVLQHILYFLDTLEVKEVESKNDIQLTWKDMRELHLIFGEIDSEIEFCRCDIQEETIGYYQDVLKRFKALKGE